MKNTIISLDLFILIESKTLNWANCTRYIEHVTMMSDCSLIAKESSIPTRLITFAGRYAIHRNIVGAVIQPLPDCGRVVSGN
jgi:hypothetical protein